jgi:TRAP-type C4-dicarboxylate transport system permease small subunit
MSSAGSPPKGLLDTAAMVVERLLEIVVVLLMVALTALIVVSVVYRKMDASLSFADEVAAIMLAWLTYYGSALAALKRAHIGFDGLLLALPTTIRLPMAALSEALVIFFFALMAWMGWKVLMVLEGMTLISLTWVPVQVTQSVIPIGAALFILCQLLSLPAHWRRVKEGVSHEREEIEEITRHHMTENQGQVALGGTVVHDDTGAKATPRPPSKSQPPVTPAGRA